MTPTRLATLLFLSLFVTASVASNPPRIAIIIDDLGYRYEAGQRAIRLPGPIAYAVLPGTPRAEALASLAHDAGKEVLLHLPLQSATGDLPEEPLGLRLDMSRQEFQDVFDKALTSVPHVIGINSHRGSLLTRHPGHMQWLMEEIRARDNLFFIDSYTTSDSVALRIAEEAGVSAVKRDVFLDPDRDPATVAREFERMKRLAESRGAVIAIGHPYSVTLDLLERELPALEEQGFELVPVSQMIR